MLKRGEVTSSELATGSGSRGVRKSGIDATGERRARPGVKSWVRGCDSARAGARAARKRTGLMVGGAQSQLDKQRATRGEDSARQPSNAKEDRR